MLLLPSSLKGAEWWVGMGLEIELLNPSPRAEPAVRISRNGLPRLLSPDHSSVCVIWSSCVDILFLPLEV